MQTFLKNRLLYSSFLVFCHEPEGPEAPEADREERGEGEEDSPEAEERADQGSAGNRQDAGSGTAEVR